MWRDGTYISEGEVLDADVAAVMDATVDAIEAQGATVVEVDVAIEDSFGPEFDALLCEFKADLPGVLRDLHRRGLPEDAPGRH